MANTAHGTTQAALDNARAAKSGIKKMAEKAGLEGCEDPGTGVYHMIHKLLDYCDVNHLDFDQLLSEVRHDAE